MSATGGVAPKFCSHCGHAVSAEQRYCANCGQPVGGVATPGVWRGFRRQSIPVQILAWVFGYWILIHIYFWSGTTWPWYGKLLASVAVTAVVLPFMFA
jgi:hypothetical protein